MFGNLLKLAKGNDLETLKPALKAMGFELDMSPISLQEAPANLRKLALDAGRRGAALHRLSGTMKGGARIEAFIVLVPPEEGIAKGEIKELLSPA